MTPAQQQIWGEWQQAVQQTVQQVQRMLKDAEGGCQGLIAQNPTDPTPLANALNAIRQQVMDFGTKLGARWSDLNDRLSDADAGDDLTDEGQAQEREMRAWIERSWARYEKHWQLEHLKAMWPRAQQAMGKPVPCSRCGAPIHADVRAQSATVTCPACRSVVQVMPDAAVATYFAYAPDIVAAVQTMDKYFAIENHKNAWERRRCDIHRQSGDWPDQPLDSLKEWERLEKDYWTSYAAARAAIEPASPEQQAKFVESRVKFFYDEMRHNDVWQQAHGGAPAQVQVPRDARDWGPLRPDQTEEFFYHQMMLQFFDSEPDKQQKLLQKFGYRDMAHRRVVEQTFNEHMSEQAGSNEMMAAQQRAMQRAMGDRNAFAIETAGDVLSPIEGVTMEVYAGLQAKIGGTPPEQFNQILAQQGMDREKWDRVAKLWLERMSTDTTGTVATAYSQAFLAAGSGKFGAAGQAAAQGMVGGAMASAEPVSFEKYAEISGAMAAWSKQGKDVNAGLNKHFQMNAQDFSQVAGYWSQKMMQDFSMFDRLSQLTTQYEQKYMAMP